MGVLDEIGGQLEQLVVELHHRGRDQPGERQGQIDPSRTVDRRSVLPDRMDPVEDPDFGEPGWRAGVRVHLQDAGNVTVHRVREQISREQTRHRKERGVERERRRHERIRRDRQCLLLQRVSQPRDLSRLAEIGAGKLGRNTETDNTGDVLGTGSSAPLLATTLDQGFDRRAIAEYQRTNALGAANLVCRQAQHIDAERTDIELNPARRLDGVGMDQPASAVDDLGSFRNRLNSAGLVIGGHQRYERPPTT